MEFRRLGRSGLKVPCFSFGTATFGGTTDFFRAWGSTDVKAAERLIDLCLDHGVCMFDSSDVYSNGAAEEILGRALRGKRARALISTKGTFRTGPGANDLGSSRAHVVRAVDASLARLGVDHVDLYQMHGFDPETPVEETLRTLDDLVRAGKIRYLGCSNFSGWHLMKSLATADRFGYSRYVAHQAYYSLLGRDYEWELMPLAEEEGVGAVVWSPLGWGRLTGKFRRGQPAPAVTRLDATADAGPPVPEAHLFGIVDAMDEISKATGRTLPQIGYAWLLARPTVATIILGARDESQLKQNLEALDWRLSPDQLERLDRASEVTPPYPYWHQRAIRRDRARRDYGSEK